MGDRIGYSKIFVIHTLVVHPDFLKAGVGKKLISLPVSWENELHMKAIRLDAYENNIPAIKLYEKFGFDYIDTVEFRLGRLRTTQIPPLRKDTIK